MTRERITLGLLLASIFAIRAIHLDQPIVENYVGRQIPTAMVARNLERGSGFLNPQLDTFPHPNLFLVEPPIYAQLVASIRPIIGFDREPTGRLVSAAAVAFGAWGLFGLVRRREGLSVAYLALASFGLFPVMIRYGRAFQPDALMVGCVLAGLRGWDEYEERGNWRWAVFGGFVLATGLTLKITVGWALIPFLLIVKRWPIGWRLVMGAMMLIPAGLWYLYAWKEIATTHLSGSMASADNAKLWLKSLSLDAWLRFSTFDVIGRGLIVRSFTPVGFVLAFCGLILTGKLDRLWWGWAVGSALSIICLAAKWHHAYYWMVVAPLAAVGVGRTLICLGQRGRWGRSLAIGLGSFFLAMSLVQSRSTWETPVEWASLKQACQRLEQIAPSEGRVTAAEAVLYYADLKGFRLEFSPKAVKRAAGELSFLFGDTDDPFKLVESYRRINQLSMALDRSRFVQIVNQPGGNSPFGKSIDRMDSLIVADVGLTDYEPRRRAWRQEIRDRPDTTILADEPGFLIAELH